MNKENVRKVIAALRSGKYEQGRNQLRTVIGSVSSDKFCCLGVACDVSELGEWDFSSEVYNITPMSQSRLSLPVEVAEWLGFDSTFGPPVLNYINSAEANDAEVSFEDIADEWERLLEEEK